jgi:glycosyltransferase involved in cell wall biosynthesis
MMAAEFDQELIEPFAKEIIRMPMANRYERSDEFASRWVEHQFAPARVNEPKYDLIIHGGWPLFGATATFRTMADKVLFLDHGVVPTRGYPPFQTMVLKKLVELRRKHLRKCSLVAAVSRFIGDSQTTVDTEGLVPLKILLNGTDHLEPRSSDQTEELGPEIDQVRELAKDHDLLLNLGRFESGTYKNSQAAVAAFELIRSARPKARLLVLETAENLKMPPHISEGIIPLGFPSDVTLAAIIKVVDAGISLSQWEGFNLPLVELLRAKVPAFALRIGAHPEVVPDPYFLNDDGPSLAARVLQHLENPGPAKSILESAETKAHWDYLTWDRFMTELLEFLAEHSTPTLASTA